MSKRTEEEAERCKTDITLIVCYRKHLLNRERRKEKQPMINDEKGRGK